MPALYTNSHARLAAESLHGALDRALESYAALDAEAVDLHRENRRLRRSRNMWRILALASAGVAVVLIAWMVSR